MIPAGTSSIKTITVHDGPVFSGMDKKTITFIAGAAAAAGLASIFLKKVNDNREAEEEPPVHRGRKPGTSWERYQQRMKEKEKENRSTAGPNKTAAAPSAPVAHVEPKQPKCFCKYCGEEFRNVKAMAYDGRKCFYHPDGSYKGPHAVYEGSEKPEYTCKYCGQRFRTLRLMAVDGRKCPYHPNGSYKGRHEPSL